MKSRHSQLSYQPTLSPTVSSFCQIGCPLTPCRFVRKYKERSCERFLSEEEFRHLGRVLDEVVAEGKIFSSAVAAFCLLMLSGCRRNDILTLHWEEVELEADEFRLRDAKTGARSVALSPSARRVLAALPRLPDNPWVIAGAKPGTRPSNLNNAWLVIRARAELKDVRIHDLRHSFASRALALGESLPMIGKLLGHRKVQTTARFGEGVGGTHLREPPGGHDGWERSAVLGVMIASRALATCCLADVAALALADSARSET